MATLDQYEMGKKMSLGKQIRTRGQFYAKIFLTLIQLRFNSSSSPSL